MCAHYNSTKEADSRRGIFVAYLIEGMYCNQRIGSGGTAIRSNCSVVYYSSLIAARARVCVRREGVMC